MGTTRKQVIAGAAVLGLALAGCSSGSGSDAVTSTVTAAASGTATAEQYGPGPAVDIGGDQSNLRDVRYCEVLPATRDGNTFTASIYNTIGLSECPADLWDDITEDKVTQAYDAASATLNGPRHWVLDGISAPAGSDSSSNKSWFFGGIQFGFRGTIEEPAKDVKDASTPYYVKQVTRHTTWKYDADKPVFELTDPDGNVYTMQSYALFDDPDLRYDTLPVLGEKLKLPDGWTYNTRMLDAPFDNVADGTAYVVQDDLGNSYMRRPK